MLGGKSDNSAEGSQNVQQAGGDIHGMPPETHARIIQSLLDAHKAEREALIAAMSGKHSAELTALRGELDRRNAQILELQNKLQNPEAAYKADMDRIRDLEARLDREANRFGADRIAAAKAALRDLDYSKAEALFEEIKADAALAVDASARASFGLGEIAEAQVKWGEAADHYATAARLAPDLDRLKKAREFTWRAGSFEMARSFGTELISMAKDEGSQEVLATALNEHANTLQYLDATKEAVTLYRQALEIDRATIGELHPDYSRGLNNLALLLKRDGRPHEALPIIQKAIELGDETDPIPAQRATKLNTLGTILFDLGSYSQAESHIKMAIEIWEKNTGLSHPSFATCLNNLAMLMEKTNRLANAETLLSRALEINESTLPREHPNNLVGVESLKRIRAKLAQE